MKNLWLSENATQAAQAPRIHDQLYPEYVEYEAGFPEVETLRHPKNLKFFKKKNKNSTYFLNFSGNYSRIEEKRPPSRPSERFGRYEYHCQITRWRMGSIC